MFASGLSTDAVKLMPHVLIARNCQAVYRLRACKRCLTLQPAAVRRFRASMGPRMSPSPRSIPLRWRPVISTTIIQPIAVCHRRATHRSDHRGCRLQSAISTSAATRNRAVHRVLASCARVCDVVVTHQWPNRITGGLNDCRNVVSTCRASVYCCRLT